MAKSRRGSAISKDKTNSKKKRKTKIQRIGLSDWQKEEERTKERKDGRNMLKKRKNMSNFSQESSPFF